MKSYCIINLQDIDDWTGFGRIDRKHAPTMFYFERADVERELFRLQKKYPEGEFYLFESVGKVVQSLVNPDAAHIEEPETIG